MVKPVQSGCLSAAGPFSLSLCIAPCLQNEYRAALISSKCPSSLDVYFEKHRDSRNLPSHTFAPPRPLPSRTRTHLGNLILCTLGLSASWNNNRSPAFSVLNSKCLSFLSFVILASGVYLASNRVTSGVSVEADWNVSGDRDGDRDCLDGEGR